MLVAGFLLEWILIECSNSQANVFFQDIGGSTKGRRNHTVANQQMRTSYRCPGVRFSRKNHESVPSGTSAVGNDAFNWVRTTPF